MQSAKQFVRIVLCAVTFLSLARARGVDVDVLGVMAAKPD